MTTLPDSRVQNGGGPDILIGDVNFRAVGTQTELFGIGAGGNFAQEFFLDGVHQADAIGGLVGRRLVVIVRLTIEYWRCEILFAHSSAYISILSLSTPPYTIYTYNIYLFLVSRNNIAVMATYVLYLLTIALFNNSYVPIAIYLMTNFLT